MESDNLVEVEVEFDYEAELSDELSLKTGEIIENVKRMDGGWWEGTLNGKRGVFPDNFVKILSRDNSSKVKSLKSSTGPQSSTTPSVEDLEDTSGVQLRRGQGSRVSANNKKKQCRVLFSYQPKHEDELKLELDDVLDFVAEVEDGWWKGKLRGRVGVFPSNFVEMIKASAPANDDEQTVADKNKRNEKLKVEKNPRPASKISSLIQEAENKAAKKKSSIENLNLMKRESPLGGEDNSPKPDDLSNAPKLPPKPGSRQGPIPIQDKSDTNNNQTKNGGKREFKKSSGGLMSRKGVDLPEIQVTHYSDDFEMPPLETLSPFDFMAPLKEDDSVFFMGTLTGMAKSAEKSVNSTSSESKVTPATRMIKRVLSTPKELSKSGSDRRKSIGNYFKTNKQRPRVRHSSINENDNDDCADTESISSSFSNSISNFFGGKSFGSFKRRFSRKLPI